jgi:hypothetical protein
MTHFPLIKFWGVVEDIFLYRKQLRNLMFAVDPLLAVSMMVLLCSVGSWAWHAPDNSGVLLLLLVCALS